MRHRKVTCLPLLVICALSAHSVNGLNLFDAGVPTVAGSGVPDGAEIGFGFAMTQHALPNGQNICLCGKDPCAQRTEWLKVMYLEKECKREHYVCQWVEPDHCGASWHALDNHLVSENSVLVSAPKANGPQGREGGVYSCPIASSSTCQPESIFQSRDNNNYDGDVFAGARTSVILGSNESYPGQLMGYSLRSLPNHVVACAPLFTSITNLLVGGVTYPTGRPDGRCVVLQRNLSNVLQLTTQEVDFEFGGADIGAITNSGAEYVVLGSPLSGPAIGDPPGQVWANLLESPSESTRFSSEQTISTVITPLLGYHIETGHFTNPNLMSVEQIAVSAPRGSNHMGFIQIFTALISASSSLTPVFRNINPLTGDEPDGYFGYDFASVDLNTGGYSSLVVGCPLCNRDRGRIYIYVHTGNPSNPFGEPIRLASPSLELGRFGTVVENIGDVDLDGYSDLAVSTPYEGSGVVYIFRGSSSGLVSDTYQRIEANSGSNVFGYTLSGGLDIDNNGYPDLTVGELSGSQVTTFRAVPLVNVTLDFLNRMDRIDLVDDRVCDVQTGRLICFNVTPCFQYESIEGSVPQFALKYTLVLDEQKVRVGLIEQQGGETVFGSNTVVRTTTIPGPLYQSCPESFTFALRADFTETEPISVQLSIDDADDRLPLQSDSTSTNLGGPLRPALRRYIHGDERDVLSTEYNVSFFVNCSSGMSEECEPMYGIDITEHFPFAESDNVLVLAPANVFGFNITVTNMALDDGLSPVLRVQLPNGIRFINHEEISPNAVTDCQSRGTIVQCQLRNPTPGESQNQLQLNFNFNVSAISLETKQLPIQFRVDGLNAALNASQTRSITLDAVGSYRIRAESTQEQYQAIRHPLTQNTTTIPLNSTGPQISFNIIAENNRANTSGTTIPRSTIAIHLPTDIIKDTVEQPLLIPTDIVSFTGNVNCSHYNALSRGLSSQQLPPGFVLEWEGTPPAELPECQENQRFRCGVILCTVTNMEPSAPPLQLTVFARLFSPSVRSISTNISIYTTIQNETELPRIDRNSTNTSQASFTVIPAVLEMPLECIRYWIIVVSVVAGLIVLLIIIAIMGACGLFRTWYKVKKDEGAPEDTDAADNGDFIFRQRTVPPIPGVFPSEPGNPELVSYYPQGTSSAAAEKAREAAEAEKEAREEAERLEMIGRSKARATSASINSSKKTTPEPYPDFDPHKGVDEDYEGEETEI